VCDPVKGTASGWRGIDELINESSLFLFLSNGATGFFSGDEP
jgi:hypothetical protein